MAASARMSGTSAPESSNLKRGCRASWSWRAFSEAEARERDAAALVREVVTFFFLRVSFWDPGVRSTDERVRLVAGADSAGRPTITRIDTAQTTRARLNRRDMFTGNSLANKLLRVSAFYQEICMMQEVLRARSRFCARPLRPPRASRGLQGPKRVPR